MLILTKRLLNIPLQPLNQKSLPSKFTWALPGKFEFSTVLLQLFSKSCLSLLKKWENEQNYFFGMFSKFLWVE